MIRRSTFFTQRSLSACLALLGFCLTSAISLSTPLLAQTQEWQWAKQLRISQKTDWDASTVDDQGNFYFVGTSEKFTGNTPARAIVISKWSSDTTLLWSKNLVGGKTTTDSYVQVDASGNVYFAALFSGVLTRTDGSTMEHPLALQAYVIGKFDKDGNELWTKKLTLADIFSFDILSNGSIGLFGYNDNGSKEFSFGDSTVSSFTFANHFLEISPDGGVRQSVTGHQLFSGAAGSFFHTHWSEPGKIRAMFSGGGFSSVPIIYAEIDLAAPTITGLDTLLLTASNGGTAGIAFGQSIYDPSSGHIFAIVKAGENGSVLNERDTLLPPVNNVNKEGYIIELDEQMNLLHKLRVTNPELLAMRDTQIVLTALLHTNFGFVSDEISIPWQQPTMGHVVYVMNPDFKHTRHATMRPKTTGSTPENVMIDANGGVYLHIESNYDMYFDQRVFFAPLSSDASIIVLGKVGGSPVSSVRPNDVQTTSLAYPNPASGFIHFTAAPNSTYEFVDMLGRRVIAGVANSADASSTIDVSMLPVGTYILRVSNDGESDLQMITIAR
jgi:hypothetical protein